MARLIGNDRRATPVRTRFSVWAESLAAQRAGLCIYQWVWIIICVVGALIFGAPRVLSQPVIYSTSAEVRFDMSRYGGLYVNGQPGADFAIATGDATSTLHQRALARRDLRFGRPDYQSSYTPLEPGVVRVVGIAPTASDAQQLVQSAADELVRQVQAAGGREVLRNLLGWALVAAMRGEPAASPFETHLRRIIERHAFPMSRPIEPVSARISVENLTPEERDDMARALEARYDLWTFEINTRNATLDSLCGTAGQTMTAVRETALQACAVTSDEARLELGERNRVIARRQAIDAALQYLMKQYHADFRPDTPDTAYRTAVVLPAQPEPRYIGLSLVIIALVGLAFGGVSVAVDRTAGVMPKLRELWAYRELIADLVVRDLRVRYKGSVLGYLWTQLAPLMMMTVFTFVFTTMMPSGIALFPIFLIVGLLPWNYCSEAITSGTRSVLDNANLIKKVFFPREILPLVSVFSSLLNYLLSLPMMFLVLVVIQWFTLGTLNISWTFLYLPVIIIVETLFLIGVTLFVSALAVFFRDIVHLVGILIMFWFFLTPVFYSLDSISPVLARVVRWLNPMASMIEFYREILYGRAVGVGMIPTPGLPALDSGLRVVVTTLLVLAAGYWFFQRMSKQFGEEL